VSSTESNDLVATDAKEPMVKRDTVLSNRPARTIWLQHQVNSSEYLVITKSG